LIPSQSHKPLIKQGNKNKIKIKINTFKKSYTPAILYT